MKRGLAVGIMIAIAVVVGVGAFFGGHLTAGGGTPTPAEAMKVIQNLTQEQRAQLAQNGGGLGGTTGGTGPARTGTRANGAGGFTTGSIVSKDAGSITIKTSDGNSKIILYSSSTSISETKDTTIDALTVGEDVTVTGSTNSDGTVTATRITLGTAAGAGFGTGGTPTSAGTGTSGGTTATTGAGQTPAGGGGTPPSGGAPGGNSTGSATTPTT
jgi:hypothetical protein